MALFSEIIYTPRLLLRRIRETDLALLVSWGNSVAANGEYLSCEELGYDSYQERFESGFFWTDKNRVYLIEHRDGDPLGTIHFWLRPEREECAVVKVRIAVPHQRGSGYGTEAQKYLIINLFDHLSLTDVEMYTDINNIAQQRCLKKLGFELIDSLTYEDHQVQRLGHLFRLPSPRYHEHPIYRYHYE